ncbi:hypothetical protein [Ramlibacter sp. AN1133]|uniref:hypothetical protein n=1 Tax=Ramlibacter sp. AN1133 TaxID=3133429 RepID=UPI0030BDEA6E
MSPQERIRRLLQERLGWIGVAPDLRNDGPAVRAVAALMKLPLDQVVNELVEMRTQQNLEMARRLGQASLTPAAVTLLAASRDSLLGRDPFEVAFHRRAEQDADDLVRSFGAASSRPRAMAV